MSREYLVESQWAGFTGGYGSESYISQRLNQRAREGWTLFRTEANRCAWWGVVPRIKLLTIFERDAREVRVDGAVTERSHAPA